MAERSSGEVRRLRGQHLVLALAAVALLAVVVAGLWTYAWPSGAEDALTFDVGSLDDFPPGSVTSYVVGSDGEIREYDTSRAVEEYPTFHLVRLEDGEVLALLARPAHPLATGATWRPDMVFNGMAGGWFRDGPTGSTYDIAGHRVFGPAPRDLDRAALRIEDGRVVVNLARVTEGSPYVYQPPTDALTATPAATEPAQERD